MWFKGHWRSRLVFPPEKSMVMILPAPVDLPTTKNRSIVGKIPMPELNDADCFSNGLVPFIQKFVS
jgi:hypothetical protein